MQMNPIPEDDDLYSGPPMDPRQQAYQEARERVLHNRRSIQATRLKMAALLLTKDAFKPRLFDLYVDSHKQAMELDTVFLRQLIHAFLDLEEHRGLPLARQYELLEMVLREGT